MIQRILIVWHIVINRGLRCCWRKAFHVYSAFIFSLHQSIHLDMSNVNFLILTILITLLVFCLCSFLFLPFLLFENYLIGFFLGMIYLKSSFIFIGYYSMFFNFFNHEKLFFLFIKLVLSLVEWIMNHLLLDALNLLYINNWIILWFSFNLFLALELIFESFSSFFSFLNILMWSKTFLL